MRDSPPQPQLMFIILLLFTCVSSLLAESVHYKDCGSKANVTELRVSGCTNPPCVFIKGLSYEVEIDAISNSATTKLPYKITAKLKFIPITILKGNACTVLSKGTCPVKIGDEFTYKNTIKVSTTYPSFHTKVTALVQDDNKRSVICVILDVIIKK